VPGHKRDVAYTWVSFGPYAELEEELTKMKEDLDSLTKERHALKEDLDETKARLTTIERIKNEQEAQNVHLAEHVKEMALREENREVEHEELISDITEKVLRLRREKTEALDQSIQHQQRNQHLLAQLDRFKEDEKKSQHAMAEATRRTKQLELDLAKAKRLTPNSAVIGGGLALLCLGAMSARVFRPGK
jgi:chromosome segregation ATPase